MASWIRCERCRKVLAAEQFDAGSPVCKSCLAGPVAKPRVAKASPVKTERSERVALVGVAGSGDLEVRERRARRAATDALVEAHAEEFEGLLAAARQVEGLRA